MASLADDLSREEKRALLDVLASTIKALGRERVLTRPIVLPDERHFPDRWTRSAVGAARLCRRLMRFAGVASDVHVVATTDNLVAHHAENAGWSSAWRSTGSCIQLAGVDAAEHIAFVFVVDVLHLDDPDAAVGAAALEVARGVRLFEGIRAEDATKEAPLVAITAIALGLGVLVVNDTLRTRSIGEMRGGAWYSEHRTQSSGTLSPRAAAYVFAALAKARGMLTDEILGALEINQRSWAKSAASELAREFGDELAARIGLPSSSSAPASINIEAMLAPLPDDGILAEGDDDDVVEDLAEHGRTNAGRPVFRVGESYAAAGLVGGGLLGMVTGALTFSALGLVPAVGAFLVVIGGGFVLGLKKRYDVCADTQCNTRIPDDAETCPGCEGTVAGRIKSPADRLDAQEEWLRSERARRNEPPRN